jgi:hypothetical protein
LLGLFSSVAGNWLEFTEAIIFSQCQIAGERLVIPVHGNRPLKVGLLRSLMKIAGLEESDL